MPINLGSDISVLTKLDITKFLKRKDVAVILIIVLAAFFVLRIILQQQSSRVEFLKKKLVEQQEASKLSMELEKLDGDFLNLEKDLPKGTISTVNIVDRIAELARRRNISISSITPKSQLDKGLYWEYPFEIEMEANYRQSRELLSDIENSKDFFKVSFLSVAQVTTLTKKDLKQTRVKMGISAFSLKK